MKIKRLLGILFLVICFSSCKSKVDFSNSFIAMDTYITIKGTCNSKNEADDLIATIRSLYEQYSQLADCYQAYSGINNIRTLNEERSIQSSPELMNLIEYAIAAKTATSGYFEPLIGGLSTKWKECLFPEAGEPTILDESIIKAELAKIASSRIIIDQTNNTIKIEGEANIDLGGLAKGYATNLVYEILKSRNITAYLINAGNSNILVGQKAGNKPYKIGISSMNGNTFVANLEIKNTGICTSSIREQYVTIKDEYYHHLINPKTGYPTNYYETVSIIGENAGELDYLSTALFAMPLETLKLYAEDNSLHVYCFKDNKQIYSYIPKENE